MQNYEYEHNSFILYKDSRIFINRLSKCQRGELLLAIFDYVCDGIIPDFEDDVMLQMCFDIIRSYLDRDEKKYRDKCEKNRKIAIEREENKRKQQRNERAKSYTNEHERAKSYTNSTDKDTDKDTDTDSDTDTVSDTDTETDTEHACAASADRQSASAAAINAEPPSGDLFSVDQLISTSKRNKVELTSEGIEVFHEEMQESGWVLYGKPVEKKGIVKALRGWAKYHPEFAPEENKPTPKPAQKKPKVSIDDQIMEIASEYITQRLFDEHPGGHHCLIRDYCPKEAFTKKQLEYMAENWSVWPKTKEYVLKDEYWYDEEEEGSITPGRIPSLADMKPKY